jgi:hypothetical protein
MLMGRVSDEKKDKLMEQLFNSIEKVNDLSIYDNTRMS